MKEGDPTGWRQEGEGLGQLLFSAQICGSCGVQADITLALMTFPVEDREPNKKQTCCPRALSSPTPQTRCLKGTSLQVKFSREEQLQGPETSRTSCLQDASREDRLCDLPTPLQHDCLSTFLEEKGEDSRSPSCPRSIWETEREGFLLEQKKGDSKTGKFLENSTASIQQQRDRAKEAQKEVTGMKDEGKGSPPGTEGQGTTEGIQERNHDQGLLAPSLRGRGEDAELGTRQEWDQPSVLGQSWVLQGLGTKSSSTTEKPQEWTGAASVSTQEDQAAVALQDMIKVPV